MRTHERYFMITKGFVPLAVPNPSRSWNTFKASSATATATSTATTTPAAPASLATSALPAAPTTATAPVIAPVIASSSAAVPGRGTLLGVATGATAMACVGGSVAVSSLLAGAPVFTAEAVRYGLACLILVTLAKITGRTLKRPRGTEWLWLAGIGVTGLVLFNLALVEGSRHARPAALAVAV